MYLVFTAPLSSMTILLGKQSHCFYVLVCKSYSEYYSQILNGLNKKGKSNPTKKKFQDETNL